MLSSLLSFIMTVAVLAAAIWCTDKLAAYFGVRLDRRALIFCAGAALAVNFASLSISSYLTSNHYLLITGLVLAAGAAATWFSHRLSATTAEQAEAVPEAAAPLALETQELPFSTAMVNAEADLARAEEAEYTPETKPEELSPAEAVSRQLEAELAARRAEREQQLEADPFAGVINKSEDGTFTAIELPESDYIPEPPGADTAPEAEPVFAAEAGPAFDEAPAEGTAVEEPEETTIGKPEEQAAEEPEEQPVEEVEALLSKEVGTDTGTGPAEAEEADTGAEEAAADNEPKSAEPAADLPEEDPVDYDTIDKIKRLDDFLDYAAKQKASWNFRNAAYAYERALSLYHEDSYAPFIIIDMANINKSLGRYHKAIAIYELAFTLRPVRDSNSMREDFVKTLSYLEAVDYILTKHGKPELPYSEIPSGWLAEIELDYNRRRRLN